MIEIQECLDQSEDHSVYRILLHNQEATLWTWTIPPSHETLEHLVQQSQLEEGIPTFRHIIELQGQLALIGPSIRGSAITAFNSSLAPKTLYDIAVQTLSISKRTGLSLHHTSAIWLQENGALQILPSHTTSDPQHLVLMIGLWLLGHLSDQDTSQIYTFAQQNRISDYNRYLEFCLRSVKPGLPNAQWNQNAIQSLQHMTKLDPRKRWPQEEAIRILTAYREQAIGQDVRTFCQQQQRKIRDYKAHPGTRTGEVHPFTPSETPVTSSRFQPTITSTQTVALVAASTLFLLHALTFVGTTFLSNPTKDDSSESCCTLNVQHSGLKSIKILGDTPIQLSRSQRDSTHQIEPKEYTLVVETLQRKHLRTIVTIQKDSHLECSQTPPEEDVTCALNNRSLEWE